MFSWNQKVGMYRPIWDEFVNGLSMNSTSYTTLDVKYTGVAYCLKFCGKNSVGLGEMVVFMLQFVS